MKGCHDCSDTVVKWRELLDKLEGSLKDLLLALQAEKNSIEHAQTGGRLEKELSAREQVHALFTLRTGLKSTGRFGLQEPLMVSLVWRNPGYRL